DLATLDRGGAELKKGRLLSATAREEGYIAALSKFYAHPNRSYQRRATAYSHAMKKFSKRNPDDHEAAAFYALSLLASESGDNTNTNRKQAAAVLEKLFAEE